MSIQKSDTLDERQGVPSEENSRIPNSVPSEKGADYSKYQGLVYTNEIFKQLEISDQMNAYIKCVREDGKLDIALQQYGYQGLFNIKLCVLGSGRKIIRRRQVINSIREVFSKTLFCGNQATLYNSFCFST